MRTLMSRQLRGHRVIRCPGAGVSRENLDGPVRLGFVIMSQSPENRTPSMKKLRQQQGAKTRPGRADEQWRFKTKPTLLSNTPRALLLNARRSPSHRLQSPNNRNYINGLAPASGCRRHQKSKAPPTSALPKA